MSTLSWTAASGALCPRHPDVAATGTCPRCGSFLCGECTEGGAYALCPGCRPATAIAFPLSRERWTFSELWEVCAERFRSQWVLLSVAVLLSTLLGYAGSIPATLLQLVLKALGVEEPLVSIAALPLILLGGLVYLLASAGLARMAFDALEGRPLRLGVLFSQMDRAGTFALYGLMSFAVLWLPLLLALVPPLLAETVMESLAMDTAVIITLGVAVLLWVPLFLVFALPMYLASFALVYERELGPVAAVRQCWRLLSGHQWRSFGVLLVGSLVLIGGWLLCCVGLFPALAFFQLLTAGLYLCLRPRDGGRLV